MKVSKSTELEIRAICDFLNELSWLNKDMNGSYLNDVDFSKYKILEKFNKDDPEEFLLRVLSYFDSLFWEKALCNLSTLLDNCADPNEDVLEFKPEIKKGLELLKNIKT